MRSIFLLFLLESASFHQVHSTCKPNVNDGMYIVASNTGQTYGNAKSLCSSLGLPLAVIFNDLENEGARCLCAQLGATHCRLGYFWIRYTTWRREYDNAVVSRSRGSGTTYNNWYTTPGAFSSEYSALMISSTGRWTWAPPTNLYIPLCGPRWLNFSYRPIPLPFASAANLPESFLQVTLNPATLSMTLLCRVEYNPNITYVLDFEPFQGAITSVSNCENRRSNQFNSSVSWTQMWTSNPLPLGASGNYWYPDTTTTSWVLGYSLNKTLLGYPQVVYSATFGWNELRQCHQGTSNVPSVTFVNNGSLVTLNGFIYLVAVSPFDKTVSHGPSIDYYTTELAKVQFEFGFYTSSFVEAAMGFQLIWGVVLQTQVDGARNVIQLRLLTRTGDFLRLTSGLLVSPVVAGNTIIGVAGGQMDGCITDTNSSFLQGICLQTWDLLLPRAQCPFNYTNTYQLSFVVDCRTNISGASLDTCNAFRAQFQVNNITRLDFAFPVHFVDDTCGLETLFVAVPLAITVSAVYNGPSASTILSGQSLFVSVTPDPNRINISNLLNSTGGVVTRISLHNLWYCTALSISTLVSASPGGLGGCFPPSVTDDGPILVRNSNGVVLVPQWAVTVTLASPTVLEFEVNPGYVRADRFQFGLHLQVLLETSTGRRRRRYLPSGSTAKVLPHSHGSVTISLMNESTSGSPPIVNNSDSGTANSLLLFVILAVAAFLVMVVLCVVFAWRMYRQKNDQDYQICCDQRPQRRDRLEVQMVSADSGSPRD